MLASLRIAAASFCLMCLTATVSAQELPEVVLIAGELDDHPRGTHEYEKAVLLLAHGLRMAADGPRLSVKTHLGGWPSDPSTLENASTIVVISAGSDQREADHPLLVGKRLETLDRLMRRGIGLVAIHWTTFVPREKAGDRFLEWIGGHFDYESGPPPRHWASRITTATAELSPHDHPIARGLTPFTLRDEFYHDIRFRPEDPRWRPVLTADIPGVGPQVVAWAVERSEGGRGFGFTGGHFFENYFDPSFRKLLLNAIAWTTRQEIPAGGVDSNRESDRIRAAILTGHHHPAHDWRATTEALQEVLGRDPRFQIETLTGVEVLATDALAETDVLVLNYCNWERPGLSEAAQRGLLALLERGGGISVVHFANGAFHHSLPGAEASDWPAYRQRIVPRIWDHATSGHDPYGPFTVEIGEPHAITEGLLAWPTTDELYFRQVGERPATPLVTAHSKVTGASTPLAWADESGPGRVFQTALGHAAESIRSEGTAALIRRGTTWAARRYLLQLPRPEPPSDRVGTIIEDGRYGQAFDAQPEPLVLAARPAYRQPPLTVECWARLDDASGFNVLVANEIKESATHWEIYSYAGSGAFSAYLPGFEPSEIVSERVITDGSWHHVAMTFDGDRVKLWVGGQLVREQDVRRRPEHVSIDGPLMLGMAEARGYRVVPCRGHIDEVRISSLAFDPVPMPRGPLTVDRHTIGLWRFDGDHPYRDLSPLGNSLDRAPRVDPAWTPRPAPQYKADAWERESDDDWIDDRNQRMDSGSFLSHSIHIRGPRGLPITPRGIAIRVGEAGDAGVLFDTALLRCSAGWKGAFLELSPARFGLLRAPSIGASPDFFTREEPGWSRDDSFEDPRPNRRVPLPTDWARYQGLYLLGERVVLSLDVQGTSILESPWAETIGGFTSFSRTWDIAPSQHSHRALICEGDSSPMRRRIGEQEMMVIESNGTVTATLLSANDPAVRLEARGSRVTLVVAPSRDSRRARVRIWTGPSEDLPRFAASLLTSTDIPDLRTRVRDPQARRWAPIITRGRWGDETGAFAVDTLTLPFDNPYRALLYLSGVDFLPNGDVVVCSAHGDVWIVKGVDEGLERLEWHRFATGLYQPLGLKVVDGKIHVLGRDQITVLHDRDGNGEADYYENLCNLLEVPGADHAYAMNLECDSAGNFYFVKSGDRSTAHGGALLKVAPDGSRIDVVATGYRHTNGLGIGPGDVITTADNEGNWVPVTRLDIARPGGFYGFQPAQRDPEVEPRYEPPLMWMPRDLDNSAGSQAWVPEKSWGDLGGELLHLSYGQCTVNLVLRQTVGDTVQGAAIRIPVEFESGAARGRFRSQDGHLYVVGLEGWQTAAAKDGCLQRVRYTGKPLHLPVAFAATEDGLSITFSEPLDAESAVEASRYDIERWGYRYSGSYGSKHWSLERPDVEGHDPVPLERVSLSDDARTVHLRFPARAPVMQMKMHYELKDAQGSDFDGDLFLTIHRLESR